MAGDEEGRDQKQDDLFEDLDEFFAPIRDVDWGKPEHPEEPPRAPEEHVEVIRQEESEPPPEPPEEEAEAPEPAVPAEAPEPEVRPEPGGGLFPEIAEEGPGAPAEETPAPGETADFSVEEAAEHFAASVRAEGQVSIPEAAEPPSQEPRESFEEMQPPEVTEPEPYAPIDVEEDILADLDAEEQATRTVKVGTGGLGGPSWQEPTAEEIGPETGLGMAERDVPAAFLTAVILAALALGSLAIGPGAFALVAGAIVLLAQGELYGVMHKRHYQPATAVGLVSGALILAGGYFKGEAAMLSMVGLSLVATFVWYLATPADHRGHALQSIGTTVLGVVYVPLLAGYAFVLLSQPDGRALVLATIGLAFIYDTSAFVFGHLWGSRPFAPTVSPRKSWEGAIAATLVVVAVSVGAVSSSISVLEPFARSLGLAVVVAVAAPLGDLAESLLKRDLGVKDMGSILPGHGGVLDRIDSVLFVAPAAFLFLRIVL